MLRRSFTFFASKRIPKRKIPVANTAESLSREINKELAKEGTFQNTIFPCAVRLVYHVANKDPILSRLHPTAFVSVVNRTLACIGANFRPRREGGATRPLGSINKRCITMPMIRFLLANDTTPLTKASQLASGFRESGDRNYSAIAAKYSECGAQKSGCFHEQLTKGWDLCSDIKENPLRIATIYNLICMFGYEVTYTEKQIEEAKKRVADKTPRYIQTFRYSKVREEYSRRRLLTDGALHSVLSNDARQSEMRKVAWILFFDSSYQRFPRRPKKQPTLNMLELWRSAWNSNPSAHALPFMERFVSLLSRSELPKLLAEAQKSGDAKMNDRRRRQMARFEHRQKTGTLVVEDAYDATKEMAAKKISLHELAYKLQYQRMQSPTLSAEPTYVAVLKTSKAFRSPSAAKLLQIAHSDMCDKGFSYASQDF